MSQIETIIDGMQRISLSAQLRDKVAIANDASRKRCGSCYYWMKSRECPAERHVNGRSIGPSCEGRPCQKFKVTESAVALQYRRQREANEFAREYGFDEPFAVPLDKGGE